MSSKSVLVKVDVLTKRITFISDHPNIPDLKSLELAFEKLLLKDKLLRDIVGTSFKDGYCVFQVYDNDFNEYVDIDDEFVVPEKCVLHMKIVPIVQRYQIGYQIPTGTYQTDIGSALPISHCSPATWKSYPPQEPLSYQSVTLTDVAPPSFAGSTSSKETNTTITTSEKDSLNSNDFFKPENSYIHPVDEVDETYQSISITTPTEEKHVLGLQGVDLPSFSGRVQEKINSGDIMKCYKRLVRESAEYLMSKDSFPTRKLYDQYSRALCQAYPQLEDPELNQRKHVTLRNHISKAIRNWRYRSNNEDKISHYYLDKKRRTVVDPVPLGALNRHSILEHVLTTNTPVQRKSSAFLSASHASNHPVKTFHVPSSVEVHPMEISSGDITNMTYQKQITKTTDNYRYSENNVSKPIDSDEQPMFIFSDETRETDGDTNLHDVIELEDSDAEEIHPNGPSSELSPPDFNLAIQNADEKEHRETKLTHNAPSFDSPLFHEDGSHYNFSARDDSYILSSKDYFSSSRTASDLHEGHTNVKKQSAPRTEKPSSIHYEKYKDEYLNTSNKSKDSSDFRSEKELSDIIEICFPEHSHSVVDERACLAVKQRIPFEPGRQFPLPQTSKRRHQVIPLPPFSAKIQKKIEKGEFRSSYLRIIREAANFLIRNEASPTSIQYDEYARKLCQVFPELAVKRADGRDHMVLKKRLSKAIRNTRYVSKKQRLF